MSEQNINTGASSTNTEHINTDVLNSMMNHSLSDTLSFIQKEFNGQESKDDIWTVKDVLLTCNPDILADGIAREDSPEGTDPEIIKQITEELKAFICNLKEIEENKSEDLIVLGINETVNSETYMQACLFNKEELLNTRLPWLLKMNTFGISANQIFAFVAENINQVPASFSYIFEPWADILGYQVDRENLIESDKYAFMQAVLRNMSYFGINSEDAKFEQRKQLQKKAEVLEDILEHPEIEPNGRFISSEEVFESFGYVDNRIKEIKELSQRRMAMDAYASLIARYEVLRKFQERNEKNEKA